MLEKCLTEDPSHERALLLLTDCLLDGGGVPARSRNGTPSRRKEAKMETEIKTILEKEERDAVAVADADELLSKVEEEQLTGLFAAESQRRDESEK